MDSINSERYFILILTPIPYLNYVPHDNAFIHCNDRRLSPRAGMDLGSATASEIVARSARLMNELTRSLHEMLVENSEIRMKI